MLQKRFLSVGVTKRIRMYKNLHMWRMLSCNQMWAEKIDFSKPIRF